MKMNDNDEMNKDRTYIDSSSATLRYYGRTVSYATLNEAVNAWHELPNDVRNDATIKVDVEDGTLYQASEIARLHRGPWSAASG